MRSVRMLDKVNLCPERVPRSIVMVVSVKTMLCVDPIDQRRMPVSRRTTIVVGKERIVVSIVRVKFDPRTIMSRPIARPITIAKVIAVASRFDEQMDEEVDIRVDHT